MLTQVLTDRAMAGVNARGGAPAVEQRKMRVATFFLSKGSKL
jgi:hypothetical protein